MKALDNAKDILLYSDSHPNELMIGLLHLAILPFAMFELGEPFLALQLTTAAAGLYQLYAVLIVNNVQTRLRAAQLAVLIAISTVLNFGMEDMLKGSHLGWVLILVFAGWNVFRIHQQALKEKL